MYHVDIQRGLSGFSVRDDMKESWQSAAISLQLEDGWQLLIDCNRKPGSSIMDLGKDFFKIR